MKDYAWYAKSRSLDELLNAITDLSSTLQIYKDTPITDPYVKKLYAEFDAYVYEIQQRRNI